jgi:hypothetical protein
MNLIQQVDKESGSALYGTDVLAIKDALSRSDSPEVDVDGDVVLIAAHRVQIPKCVRLSSPAATINNLVVDRIESLPYARIFEG